MYSKLAYSTLRRLSLAVALLALQLMIANAKPMMTEPRVGDDEPWSGAGPASDHWGRAAAPVPGDCAVKLARAVTGTARGGEVVSQLKVSAYKGLP